MRKILLIIIIIALGLCTSFFIAISLQNILLQNSFESEYTPLEADYIESAIFVRCNINLSNPQFAKITEYKGESDHNIAFYDPKHLFSQTEKEWDTSYTGGTTIKNTTFPQLVAMVKEDCSQFQGGFVNKDPDGIRWTHTRADTKEEKAESIRRVSYGKLKLFPEFIEVYGDIDEMTDDEVIALHEQIKEEGLDAKVQMADEANDLRKELLEITQEQRDQVRQAYGEWKDFTNEEFLEWIEIIKVDMESGKFVLIGK